MSVFRFPALLVVSVLAVSCSHLGSRAPDRADATMPSEPDPKLLEELRQREHDELLRAAEQRLREVRRLLKADDLPAAEAALQPLVGQPLFQTRVAELQDEIQAAKNRMLLAVAEKQTADRALREVDERLVLPSKYGSTVVISRHETPIEVPPGPMEDLVNKKVTMTLQNAGVAELVQVLSDVEGLNVVADDALEAEKTLTINVREVPLKEVLSYIARNMGVAFHLGENIIWVTESTEPPGAGPKLETQVYRLRKGFIPSLGGGGGGDGGGVLGGGGGGASEEDNDLEDALAAVLADSPDGATYRIFKNRNLLLVRDSRENLRVVEQLIQEFDKPPYQVLIEARFLTISQDDLLDVGVEINDTTTPAPEALNPNDPEQTRVSTFLSQLGQVGGTEGLLGSVTLSGIISNRTYDLVIQALESNETTRTISAPRVTVLNNQTARIRKGDVLRYFEEYDVVTVDSAEVNGNLRQENIPVPTGTPTELELGITLDVKVNVGNNGETVLLALRPEIKSFLKWEIFETKPDGGDADNSTTGDTADNATAPIRLPKTNENLVETKVAVKSGETVILGGMLETSRLQTVKKVPILGDIPWIGFFFRRTTDEETPQHLLIFVTARVVNDTGQFVTHQDEQ